MRGDAPKANRKALFDRRVFHTPLAEARRFSGCLTQWKQRERVSRGARERSAAHCSHTRRALRRGADRSQMAARNRSGPGHVSAAPQRRRRAASEASSNATPTFGSAIRLRWTHLHTPGIDNHVGPAHSATHDVAKFRARRGSHRNAGGQSHHARLPHSAPSSRAMARDYRSQPTTRSRPVHRCDGPVTGA